MLHHPHIQQAQWQGMGAGAGAWQGQAWHFATAGLVFIPSRRAQANYRAWCCAKRLPPFSLWAHTAFHMKGFFNFLQLILTGKCKILCPLGDPFATPDSDNPGTPQAVQPHLTAPGGTGTSKLSYSHRKGHIFVPRPWKQHLVHV